MPRQPRIEYAGAVYHVMCRGDRRESVFRDDRDYMMFLATLREACGRCGWRVHAYVLMNNHYHMLLETPEANLVAGMRWLQGTYSTRFNVRHRECGHLFQGRYKALVVSGEGRYFSTVAEYIHLNPGRIKGYEFERRRLEDHKWGSYPAYVNKAKRPEWLCLERVLGRQGLKDAPAGRRRYGLLIRKRLLEMQRSDEGWDLDEEWSGIRRGWCLGGDAFREEMKELVGVVLKDKRRDSYSGTGVKQHDEWKAERLIGQGMKALGLREHDLKEHAKSSAEKYALAWLVRRRTCVKNAWIKTRLRMGTATNFSCKLNLVESAGKGDWGYDARHILDNIRI